MGATSHHIPATSAVSTFRHIHQPSKFGACSTIQYSPKLCPCGQPVKVFLSWNGIMYAHHFLCEVRLPRFNGHFHFLRQLTTCPTCHRQFTYADLEPTPHQIKSSSAKYELPRTIPGASRQNSAFQYQVPFRHWCLPTLSPQELQKAGTSVARSGKA